MDERRKCSECRADVESFDSTCPFCDTVLNDAASKKKSFLSDSFTGAARRPALKACPDCGASVSVRALSCPQCGCPSKGKQRPSTHAVVCIMMVTIVIFSIANRGPANNRGPKAPLSTPQIARGDRAVLACKGGDGVYVAFDIKAWSRLAHAQVRRDTAETERLAKDGQISLVAVGTPVEVVGPGTVMLQFRILAGPYEGREGWARKEFVRLAP